MQPQAFLQIMAWLPDMALHRLIVKYEGKSNQHLSAGRDAITGTSRAQPSAPVAIDTSDKEEVNGRPLKSFDGISV